MQARKRMSTKAGIPTFKSPTHHISLQQRTKSCSRLSLRPQAQITCAPSPLRCYWQAHYLGGKCSLKATLTLVVFPAGQRASNGCVHLCVHIARVCVHVCMCVCVCMCVTEQQRNKEHPQAHKPQDKEVQAKIRRYCLEIWIEH